MKKHILVVITSILTAVHIYSSDSLLQAFYDNNLVHQNGSFTFKSGRTCSNYIDMRSIISSPNLLKKITHKIYDAVEHISYDRVCGVPYGALPVATATSLVSNKPMILLRHATKNHGLQKQIEGQYKEGDRVLLIEDVITTGSSILESIEALKKHNLIVNDIVVVLDRQEGGVDRLKELGYRIHPVYTLSEVLSYAPTSKSSNKNDGWQACKARL